MENNHFTINEERCLANN